MSFQIAPGSALLESPDASPDLEAHVQLASETAARAIWVELATRIATKELHYRSGDEEAAAASVAGLFASSRAALKAARLCPQLEKVVLEMLNRVIRSYTARWHEWIVNGRMHEETFRRTFRSELFELRARLNPYEFYLKERAHGKSDADARAALAAAEPKKSPPPPPAQKTWDVSLKAGLLDRVQPRRAKTGGACAPLSLPEIHEKERAEIIARRVKLLPERSAQDELTDVTGLALSGGGIRSASFCLGIVQQLVAAKLFRQFDYLSTVSGGGYLGTFISSYLPSVLSASKTEPSQTPTAEKAAETGRAEEPPADNAITADTAAAAVFAPAGNRESAAVRHLRNNSKYLLSGGVWGSLKMLGTLLGGVFYNVMMLVFVPLWGVVAYRCLHDSPWWPSWDLVIQLAVATAGLLLLLPVAMLFQSKKARQRSGGLVSWLTYSPIVTGLATLLAGGLVALPELVARYQQWYAAEWLPRDGLILLLLLLTLGVGGARWGLLGQVRHVLLGAFLMCGPLMYLAVFLFVNLKAPEWGIFWIGVAAAVLTLWSLLGININQTSLHRFYREKLCGCYLATDQGGKVEGRPEMPLNEINQSNIAPYHLINATVNLPSSDNPELRGRDGDFFLFSKYVCGSPTTGYFETKCFEEADPDLDLGTAMAISGAAASSNMGSLTMKRARFFMTLLNVRLGYWLARPDRAAPNLRRPKYPNVAYLVREMFGWITGREDFLNLSDGGHIENLGAYELLRRRCKFIVVVDGGMEPGMECADLIRLQRLALIDFNITLDFDPTDLTLNARRVSSAYGIIGKIHYPAPDEESPEELGWMLYLKLAVVGNEPRYVSDYRRLNPDFPHQTTADQFFDEAQFEAYRSLGECAAKSLLKTEALAEAVKDRRPPDFSAWFLDLVRTLLPDNDAVRNKVVGG